MKSRYIYYYTTLILCVVISSCHAFDAEEHFQIEGHLETKGGSQCHYIVVQDESLSSAAIAFDCQCGMPKEEQDIKKKTGHPSGHETKYICMYGGDPDCPQFEANKERFYNEIVNLFKGEEHACLMKEIEIGTHTKVCQGSASVLERRFIDGEDPHNCGGTEKTKTHKEL